ncbi:meiotically up-regulated gene 185 protein-like protein [Dothidotthia symphoricarpi CBS 119687]|uniref:Meiotically up-regulated gene 185 protein-like protein n=1 Tax=Dothidotthia symphoricarpi CBS 119687 TaxID=1392245 RepID=A0A6A6AD39_9PLEO|nr:meiotically up-regulated gene 185 protein-like protein [Dothidotthia symphoricarpi CBS 119687]KAF2129812.1 meiotically up-regulated gene 185 protein-like protein [Dothidotthia symphoricarpi CBS 119687]
MGASQSTGGGATPGGSVEVKTSYYELLGVERTATQDEIKKAYRRKALELHPDRNYGDVERTTALFADIQSAHEVLSDEQERAWYDAHEGDILRGGNGEGATEDHYQGNMRVTTADDLARMMGKFRGKVDFSDSPSGFFGYVRETFEQLAREEEYAADYEDIDIPTYPSFGHKDDQYEGVVRDFYSAWNGFATAKSFAWLDVYRLSDAPDRRFRRAMEKENQKCRDDGRRDFNEAVRTLVAFVRKRDPRYTPNTQSDEDKAKAQRDARKAQAARSRAAHLAKLEQEPQAVPTWATERPADEEEGEEEEEVEEDIYECVACSKTFKSERQYEAHEKSKKHQKAIQSLKKKMKKDNAHLNLDDDALGSGVLTPVEGDGDVDSEADDLEDSVQDLTQKTNELEVEDVETDNDEEAHSKGPPPDHTISGPQISHDTEPVEDEDDDDDDDEYVSRSEIEARLASLKTDPSTPSAEPIEPNTTVPKLGKAKQKKAKKAAKQAEVDQSGAKNKCMGCDAAFASKTQLFQHLQDHPKHAALKTTNGGGGKKGKRK